MSVLGSLPDRPLTDGELASFNGSDALDIAVDVTEPGHSADAVVGMVLATQRWVKGVAYEDGGWRVVESVSVNDGENERFDGMQTCEDAIQDALAP